ncbi:hypothetical protein [Streptomyces phaeochromogenes]
MTITRRGMPWRRKRVEHLPLSRLRACYLLKSEVHGGESLNFWLVHDTDLVHIGLNRQYYEGDAYWFANYLSEAICERLRWIFQNTIGLGPHSEPELLRVVRPALQLHPYEFSTGDVPQRLRALRKEDHLALRRQIPGPTRPSDLQTNHARALNDATPKLRELVDLRRVHPRRLRADGRSGLGGSRPGPTARRADDDPEHLEAAQPVGIPASGRLVPRQPTFAL